MDTEVWSHADIRSGWRLVVFLYALILAKELAAIVALQTGLLAPGSTLPQEALTFAGNEALRHALAFGFTIALMALAFEGYGWTRWSLAILYLFVAGEALWRMAGLRDAVKLTASKLALGNAGLGILIGLTFLLAPTIRAFAWSQRNRRHTIPVPLDDEPARRTMRRHRTLAETVLLLLRAAGNVILVILVLGIGAIVYGFGDELRALLQRYDVLAP